LSAGRPGRLRKRDRPFFAENSGVAGANAWSPTAPRAGAPVGHRAGLIRF
jgi:hypothetical protein